MSFYQSLAKLFANVPHRHRVMRRIFNLSPMYRKTNGRVIAISEDYKTFQVKIKFSWKNANYNGTMFGGSMYAAVDPIFVVQLSQILSSDYIVWDKTAKIYFKRPAKEALYADFHFTEEEIAWLMKEVEEKQEVVFQKEVDLVNKKKAVFARVEKEIYISTVTYFKGKQQLRKQQRMNN